MKKTNKIISVILVISMLLMICPIQVFAATISANSVSNPVINSTNSNKKATGNIIGEIADKREKNVKTFQMDNGTYEAAVYPTAVHYLVNGKWKDIDNTLVTAKDANNNDVLENKDNNYKVEIAKTANSDKLVTIKQDKYEVSWNIDNAGGVIPQIKPINTDAINSLSANDKKKTLTKLTSTVDFSNIFTNTDLQYDVKPEVVKETIILKQKVDNPHYSLNLNTKNLIPQVSKDNSIVFYDDNDSSKILFKMQAPFMIDSKGEISKDVVIALAGANGNYTLSIIPNNEWLNSPDRVYPVKIDPTLSTSPDPNNIYDAYVASNSPDTNYQLGDRLKMGKGTISGTDRTYISFALPQLDTGDMIISADLSLNLMLQNINPYQVDVHKVLGNWSSSTVNWNNKPAYDPIIKDYQMVQNIQQYNWDITPIAKEWYTTGNNYGLMLMNHDETILDDSEFYSSDAGTQYQALRPQVTITYVNNSGLESYWTYHSQSVGRAGTGYTNDYNGNLIFTHNDLSMNGNRMPLTISHVFNSNDKDTNIGYGNGWRLNLNQTVLPQTIQGTQYYVYTDEDGTKHYFKYDSVSGKYEDEEGLNLSLTLNGDGTYTITDKGGNLLNFTAYGYLATIKDSNGNTISLSYQGTTLKTATDGAGRVTTLNYNAGGNLISIVDPSNRTTSFDYTGNEMTKITYPDTKYSSYAYDGNNNMASALNFDGYKAIFSYFTVQPYRVSKVQEANTDGTLGQELNMSYGNNITTFTDVNGRKNEYEFNDGGNTVCIKDNNGNAQYYQYNDATNVNKLTLQSKLQSVVTNYLQNHDLETSNNWVVNNETGSTGSSSYTTEDKYLGSQSVKITKTNNIARYNYSQQLTLVKGNTYTLSGYIKTSGISNTNGKGAMLEIVYKDGNAIWQTVDSQYINGTKDWQRVEVKFTLPSNTNDPTVYAKFSISNETGSAYFDCLQMENGSIANRYNIIENADMTYGTGTPTSWTKNGDTDSNDTLVTVTDPNYPQKLDTKAFEFNGNASKAKNIFQTINISGNAGDTFVLGGWTKGDSVPVNSTRPFVLNIGIKRADGTTQWQDVYFNQDSSDWQYAEDKITADSAYTSVTVYACYYNNANTAYFDGIQLYKEAFGQSYQYDANGNVISTADLANQNSQFQYTNNDLTKSIDPKGNSLTYQYDAKHNILNATSAENVVNSFTYDSYGNPLTAKVGDVSLFIQGSSTYTANGNYISTLKDSSGNTVNYGYDTTKGTLNTLTDAKGKVTNYSYDANLDRLTDVYKTVDGQEIRNTYNYSNDKLSQITNNGFNYNFTYDPLGNSKTASVGTQNLVTNIFEARTSKLLETDFGNGQNVSNSYDNLDRITANNYNGTTRYGYEYDASGNLGYLQDLINNVNYRYVYDLSDRLTKVSDSNGNATSYGYDTNNNLNSIADGINGSTYTTNYSFDKDNRNTGVTYNSGNSSIGYVYDTVGRITGANTSVGGINKYSSTYAYTAGTNGSSTNALQSVTNNGSAISYTYDANGNIATITQGGNVITYYYNELNEVIREDNQVLNKTITYSYDKGGNFTSKVEYAYTTSPTPTNPTKTYTYAYGDTNWKDKLTNYNGNALAYDAIGNLTNDGVYTYTWEEGRQLATMAKTGQNISFKYNAGGIRTEKIVNGVSTKYHLLGNNVTSETNGTDNIYYTYNANGALVSMNLNGVEYYYIRNGQGDITGLYDNTGTQVVSYTYDSWGKLISTTGTLASTVGVKNPYRYRGYRYDTETGLYYLQARYYNPDMGRFINADGIIGTPGELLSYNMFAYCKNNPVNRVDLDGYDSGTIVLLGTIYSIPVVGELAMGATIVVGGTYGAYKAGTWLGTWIKNNIQSVNLIKKINWNADVNHIMKGTHEGHIKGWRKFNIDPENPKEWVKLLIILKEVVAKYDSVREDNTLRGGDKLYYFTKYYAKVGEEVVVKIWESADGAVKKLSDAWPVNVK